MLYFNPQGPRGPRPLCISVSPRAGISIHKALAGLDAFCSPLTDIWSLFQSTRPSRASTNPLNCSGSIVFISIHKALAGLDFAFLYGFPYFVLISIHKALAGLDSPVSFQPLPAGDFNPQGPRGPRPTVNLFIPLPPSISIHKALAGLDEN